MWGNIHTEGTKLLSLKYAYDYTNTFFFKYDRTVKNTNQKIYII